MNKARLIYDGNPKFKEDGITFEQFQEIFNKGYQFHIDELEAMDREPEDKEGILNKIFDLVLLFEKYSQNCEKTGLILLTLDEGYPSLVLQGREEDLVPLISTNILKSVEFREFIMRALSVAMSFNMLNNNINE